MTFGITFTLKKSFLVNQIIFYQKANVRQNFAAENKVFFYTSLSLSLSVYSQLEKKHWAYTANILINLEIYFCCCP